MQITLAINDEDLIALLKPYLFAHANAQGEPPTAHLDDSPVWTLEDVIKFTGLSVSGLNHGLKHGRYPKPYTAPRQTRRWRALDWSEWKRKGETL